MEIMIYEIILHPACLLSLKFQTFLTSSTTPGDNVFITEYKKIRIQTGEIPNMFRAWCKSYSMNWPSF